MKYTDENIENAIHAVIIALGIAPFSREAERLEEKLKTALENMLYLEEKGAMS